MNRYSTTTRYAALAVVALTLYTTSLASMAGNNHRDHDKNHRAHNHYKHTNDQHHHKKHRNKHHNARHHPHHAKVISVEPVYQFVSETVPKEHCWTETVTRRAKSHSAAPLVGGAIGAVIGNRIGSDIGHNRHHRRVGTIAGAVIGAAIGNDIKRNSHRKTASEEVQHCETSYQEVRHKELIGYDVRYRYDGDIYQTHTATHPGKRIEIDCYKHLRHRAHYPLKDKRYRKHTY